MLTQQQRPTRIGFVPLLINLMRLVFRPIAAIAMMPESTFLFCWAAALYFARKKWWVLACFFGALGALTRLLGVLIVVMIFIEMLQNDKPFFAGGKKQVVKKLLKYGLLAMKTSLLPLLHCTKNAVQQADVNLTCFIIPAGAARNNMGGTGASRQNSQCPRHKSKIK